MVREKKHMTQGLLLQKHWAKNIGRTVVKRWSLATDNASVAHLSVRLWYWISERFHSILAAELEERHNVAFFSKNDSCVSRLLNVKLIAQSFEFEGW